MKKESLILSLLLVFFTLAQAVYPQYGKAGFYPNMYSSKPVTILIMPVIKRTNSDYSEGKITSVNELLLAGKGYYVMPSSILNELIIRDSLECLPDIDPVPCQIFHDRFGIDALLFIAFKNSPRGLSGNSPYNELEYSLVSSTTGKELWYYDVKIKNEANAPNMEFPNTGSFCFDLLCGSTGIFLGAIISSAYTYDRNIENASNTALANLPVGKYHPRFLLDSRDNVKTKTIWWSQKFGERLPVESDN
jgi:hypothetical protein